MDAVRWQRVKELFNAALSKEPGERALYLAESCRGDPELQHEVESLLRREAETGGPLDGPAWEAYPSLLKSKDSVTLTSAAGGRTISHYRILERIGGGGMGVVYKARDLRLDRLVALKFLPHQFSTDEEYKRRFIHEAKAASALDHPNICTVHEIDRAEDGQLFISMAYYAGESLKEVIQRGPLPIPEMLGYAEQIAGGLAAAHQKQIVHRDIKPANVMVTEGGVVKIVDFGLAQLGSSTKLTETGSTMGTPAYMSPEQAQGQTADSRSDIWSTGIVLHEMTSGRVPFRGEHHYAVIRAILEDEPEPLTGLRSGVPIALDRIVAKCLSKDPRQRYQHIEELVVDLRAVRKGAHPKPVRPPAHPVSRRWLVGSAGAATLVSIGAVWRWFTPDLPAVESLAVLPVVNESADPNTQYISDGITEGLITRLSRSPELRVLSWDTVSNYSGTEQDARTIGEELGVRAVLKSRLEHRGEALVIRSELIDSGNGAVLWRDQYSSSAQEILYIEEEISRAVARGLELRLDPVGRMAEGHGTNDPEAYRLYLQGRYYWEKRGEDLRRALQYFRDSVDRDPGFALAWSGLADTYLMLGGWQMMGPGESGPRAEAAAKRAIELNPSLGEPHATLGYLKTLLEWDWPGAEREFGRAIELNPEYDTAHHWFAYYWLTLGDISACLKEIEKARALSPLSPVINAEVAYFYSFARQYNRAEREAAKAVELSPEYSWPHQLLCHIYALQGERDKLEGAVKKSLRLSERDSRNLLVAAAAFGFVGERRRGKQLLEEVFERFNEDTIYAGSTARAFATLGERDRAFDYYEKALKDRSLIPSSLRDPMLDGIRSDPRFIDLFRRLGLDV